MRRELLDYSFTGVTRRASRISAYRLAILAASALALGAVTPPGNASAANSGSAVVATVGNHQITERELDVKVRPQMNALNNRIYEIKRQALESMADDYLLEQAASKQHLTVDEYLKRNLKTTKVTDAEARQFYDKNAALKRVPFDKIKPRLIAFMQQQRDAQARNELLASLKKDSPVKIMLQPPRFKVAITGRPSLGPSNAPVKIVEFADFQCPFCGRVEPTVNQILKTYGNKVELTYVNFPLPIHPYAFQAAQAAECAEQQGKFWPYHNALFANQSKLDVKDLKALATKVGLNRKEFDTCFDQGKSKQAVERDVQEGQKLGVTGTPSFFINGRLLVGAQPFARFKSIIDQELAGEARLKSAAK